MTKICLKQEILNILEPKVGLMFNCIIIKLNIIFGGTNMTERRRLGRGHLNLGYPENPAF